MYRLCCEVGRAGTYGWGWGMLEHSPWGKGTIAGWWVVVTMWISSNCEVVWPVC